MKEFDVKYHTENTVRFIQKYYKEHNLGGAVLGISGGKDSAVVAGLMVKAIGAENVVGLWLPCESKEEDRKLAEKLANHLGICLYTKDLTEAYKSFIPDQLPSKYLVDANINLKPRLRMTTVYYYASIYSKSSGKPFIVPGTSNACELYVGYFTKGGDNVCDLKPIADLTVDEVITVGDYLGLPKEIVHKTPDDGLSGMSDEEKLGVKYSDIAKVMNGDTENMDKEVLDKIQRMHKGCNHKFNTAMYNRMELY